MSVIFSAKSVLTISKPLFTGQRVGDSLLPRQYRGKEELNFTG